MATKTNGLSFFVKDDGKNEDLNDAFTGSLVFQPAVSSNDLTVLLHQEKFIYATNDPYTVKTIIDPTIGRELTFLVDYSQRNFIKSFTVKGPNNDFYQNPQYDDTAKLAKISIVGTADPGEWTTTLTLGSGSSNDYANLRITSKPRTDSSTIRVDCSWPQGNTANAAAGATMARIQGTVMLGGNGSAIQYVLGVKVVAYVELPDATIQQINLLDNGKEPDNNEGDGIYSAYFTITPKSGRYTLTCIATGDSSSYYIKDRENNQRTVEFFGPFNRVQPGGSMRVDDGIIVKPTPPSRVTDLIVTDIQNDYKTVTIEWTSPGDGDVGTGK